MRSRPLVRTESEDDLTCVLFCFFLIVFFKGLDDGVPEQIKRGRGQRKGEGRMRRKGTSAAFMSRVLGVYGRLGIRASWNPESRALEPSATRVAWTHGIWPSSPISSLSYLWSYLVNKSLI